MLGGTIATPAKACRDATHAEQPVPANVGRSNLTAHTNLRTRPGLLHERPTEIESQQSSSPALNHTNASVSGLVLRCCVSSCVLQKDDMGMMAGPFFSALCLGRRRLDDDMLISDVGRRKVAAGMIDEEMARTAGHTSRCSPPVQVHLDQESLAQQSSNLEARIDRGSSNNVTIEATSLDRAVNIRVLLAASRCATAQSKENPGILSQCHGKRDKKPSAASPRNCLLSKSGLPTIPRRKRP
ncbi:hypothetical protein V8C40DRAFT_184945 [Trichoderma camerunense]